jgi:diacylglycerol kinase (ATP)
MPDVAGPVPSPPPGLRLAVLVNPSSGAGRGRAVGDAAISRLRGLGHEVETVLAPDAATAEQRARDLVAATGAERVDALVVVGGDGVVHLGVNVVAGTRVPLGVIPAGTGNDLARAWGLPSDPVAATDTVDACARLGSVRDVDAIRVETVGEPAAAPGERAGEQAGGSARWVAGVTALGFDAVVNERANGWRWPRGAARYNLAIARELPLFRPVPYRLVLDGEEWRTEGLLVAVANTSSYGGGMRIAPDASPDDGLLDVVVVTPVSLPRFVRLFPRVYDGTHVEVDAVHVRRAAVVEVHVDEAGRYPRRIVAYGDGERLGPLPRRLSAVGGAVAVLSPSRT